MSTATIEHAIHAYYTNTGDYPRHLELGLAEAEALAAELRATGLPGWGETTPQTLSGRVLMGLEVAVRPRWSGMRMIP
jgi:hypothetical protein